MAPPLPCPPGVSGLQYAVRSLVRTPLYALLVIVTLAIGIGPTTAIFSVVHALLLRELPYRDPESLAVVWRFRNAGDYAPVSGPDFADFREANTAFSALAAASRESFNVGGIAQPTRVEGARVTLNFFTLLGVPPSSGTLPQSGEGRDVILGHDLWMLSFGGGNVVGKETRLNGETYRIAAVMPAGFAYPEHAQLWVPYDLTPDRLGHRAYHRLSVVGRLKPGITLAQAEADMQRVARKIGDSNPETSRGIGVSVSSLREMLTGPVRKPLLLLLGATGFLLLIACSNVANIALTRAATRRKEIAVRLALGAGVGRVAYQLLTEGMLLSGIGGLAGLLLAQASIGVLRAIGGPYFAHPQAITLDKSVLAFNFIVAALTGIVFGLAALIARGAPFDALRSGDRTDTHGGRQGRLAREAIVVSIIAFSFCLLIGACLMVRNFLKIRSIDVGVRTRDVMTLRIYLPEPKYPDNATRTAFYERFLQRLGAVPGIDSVALVSGLPLENMLSGDIVFPGESDPVAARRIASFTEISPGWFRAAGIPLLQGRDFTWDDIHHLPMTEEAPVLVNATYSSRFGHGATLGQKLVIGGDVKGMIVGVAADVKQTDPRLSTPAHIYVPLGVPLPLGPTNFAIRSGSLSPTAVTSLAREVLRQLDPDVPPYRIRTMEQVIDEALAGSRFQAVLLTVLAAIALLLATIGIYGVISFNVAQRTREIAVRMAVGAASGDVVLLVLRRVLRLALVGLLLGVTGALYLTHWLNGMLFEIDAGDPTMLTAIAAGTLVTAVVASIIPARHAAELDPM
ncbi:MAG TPA: ABC transporter permease, partial [Thermoanaerobaculia bacterium]|nr:ABC transporter permease [Thermoanaerobaculia bacterium]